jgi:hypothetical protein
VGIDLETLRFDEPLYLWLLVLPGVLLLLWGWQVRRRRADARRCVRERLLPVRERYSPLGDLAFWLCLIVAISLCLVALARPVALVSAVRSSSADFVILLDGSASMRVRDVDPDRWQRSVRFVRAFADALSWKGDRVALALFARLASPQVRLTRDPNALFFFLDHLGERSPFRIEDDTTWDTNIEEGLRWGLKLVEKDEEVFGVNGGAKAFLVISDGQAWSGQVATALDAARRRNASVSVVGVGTTAGGVIPEPVVPGGPFSPPTRSVLDRESLRQIARSGGGEYFELGREPDAVVAAKIIARVRRGSGTSLVAEIHEDLYWRFLFGAAVFLGLGTLRLKASTEIWWQIAVVLVSALILGSR